MENKTLSSNTLGFTFRTEIWITDIVFTSILTAVSIYLIVTLLYHHLRIEKKNATAFLKLPLEKRYGVSSKYLCIFIAIFSLIYQLVSIGQLVVDGKAYHNNGLVQQFATSEIVCNFLSHTAGVALVIGNFMVNLFLWFRQSIFYVQPCLKILFSKYLRFFSFAVLIIYLLVGTSLFVTYLIYVRFEVNEAGVCHFELDSSGAMSNGENILVGWTASSILMQIILLGLFIYPLLKRALWQGNLSNERKLHLIKKVKKAVILTLMCLVTDVAAAVVLILVAEENTNNATFFYNVNIVVNLLVTIACFEHWRKLLWPWNILYSNICFTSVEKSSQSVPASSQSRNLDSSNAQLSFSTATLSAV